LESKCKKEKSKEEYEDINHQKNCLELQIKNLKQNFESEIKEKKSLEKNYEKLQQILNKIVSSFKNLYLDQEKLKTTAILLKQKLNIFFEDDLSNGKDEIEYNKD
jgi:hypothetical protein